MNMLKPVRFAHTKPYWQVLIIILLPLQMLARTPLQAGESSSSATSSSKHQPDTATPPIFSADFENASYGIYTKEQLSLDWNNPSWSDGIEEKRVSVVATNRGSRALTVTFPAHTYGPEKNGAVWRLKFDESYPAVEARFDVMFKKGFGFARGGKLPGLFGGKGNTGGDKPTGKDGFSARMMWREDGRVVQYLYYPDQPDRYGHQIPWIDPTTGKQIKFQPGQWHTVVHQLAINTPGKNNGTLRAFFDGKVVLDIDDLRFRDTNDFAIDGFLLSTFFGGGDASWQTTAEEILFFDNFRISKIPN
ncbi:MAG: hypothetical protein KAT50_05720 [Pirellulales bacterium]|nr:hypothetical protein [Pirellulales bacterium]